MNFSHIKYYIPEAIYAAIFSIPLVLGLLFISPSKVVVYYIIGSLLGIFAFTLLTFSILNLDKIHTATLPTLNPENALNKTFNDLYTNKVGLFWFFGFIFIFAALGFGFVCSFIISCLNNRLTEVALTISFLSTSPIGLIGLLLYYNNNFLAYLFPEEEKELKKLNALYQKAFQDYNNSNLPINLAITECQKNIELLSPKIQKAQSKLAEIPNSDYLNEQEKQNIIKQLSQSHTLYQNQLNN